MQLFIIAFSCVLLSPLSTQVLATQECGLQFTVNKDRVYEEVNANAAEFPWMVSIQIKFREEEEIMPWWHVCGGSILSPRVILTAAHCIWYETGDESRPRTR